MYSLTCELCCAIRDDDVERAMRLLDDHPDLFDYVENNKYILWEKGRDWRVRLETEGSRRMILAFLSRPDPEVARVLRSNTVETGGFLSALCFRQQDDPNELAEVFATVLERAQRLIPMYEFLHMEYEGGGNVCHTAAELGHVRILEMLVDAGMSIETTDRTGRHLGHYATSDMSSMAMLEYVHTLDSENIARPDADGKLPLHSAATVDACRFLLELYPEGLHVRCNNGFTPLAYAAMEWNRDAVVYLLRMGADPSIAELQDNHEVPRLVWACNPEHGNLTEDEVTAVRYEVYFSPSLLERLLDA